jgi:hypothetical protein
VQDSGPAITTQHSWMPGLACQDPPVWPASGGELLRARMARPILAADLALLYQSARKTETRRYCGLSCVLRHAEVQPALS